MFQPYEVKDVVANLARCSEHRRPLPHVRIRVMDMGHPVFGTDVTEMYESLGCPDCPENIEKRWDTNDPIAQADQSGGL